MGNSVSDVMDYAMTPFNSISLELKNVPQTRDASKTTISHVQQNVDVAIDALKESIFQALKSYEYLDEDCHIITDVLIYAELRGNNQGIVKLVTGGLKPTCPTKLQIIQDLYKKYNPTKLQELASMLSKFSEDELIHKIRVKYELTQHKNHENLHKIKTVYETKLSAKIDGGQRIGMVVLHHGVKIAISKAKEHGMSIVTMNNYSSPSGALGYWSKQICEEGLIGIVMGNCPEYVAPYGSYEPIFGTNPISIGIPTSSRPQILDMATSASAYYGLVVAAEKGEKIPLDVAYDAEGHTTDDPMKALKGALQVFDRSFKGSHLALMVELLAGALPGASMTDKKESKNWGSTIIVIDPALICPLKEFQERADQMCTRVSTAKVLHCSKGSRIYLPGERGDEMCQQNIENGTISLDVSMYDKLLNMIKQ